MTISPEAEPTTGEGNAERPISLAAGRAVRTFRELKEHGDHRIINTDSGHKLLIPHSGTESAKLRLVDPTETDDEDAPK